MSGLYSPELRPPKPMAEIDPDLPAMAGMLRILRLTQQKQTAAFRAPAGVKREKLLVPGPEGNEIPVDVFCPEEAEGPLPGLLLLHGGAFYLPIQISAFELACVYAEGLHVRVYVPEYRLVPEHPAPAALLDCEAVWDRLCAGLPGLDPRRLLVMGDSAGAALAAGLCIRLRDEGKPLPKGQLLLYPALDDRAERYASYARFSDAPWTPKATRAMWRAYLKAAPEALLPQLAPLRCDNLRGLPPAYVEPQEQDILRDEAEAYADALEAAGVGVELHLVLGSYHGFDNDLSSALVQRVLARRSSAAKRFLQEV